MEQENSYTSNRSRSSFEIETEASIDSELERFFRQAIQGVAEELFPYIAQLAIIAETRGLNEVGAIACSMGNKLRDLLAISSRTPEKDDKCCLTTALQEASRAIMQKSTGCDVLELCVCEKGPETYYSEASCRISLDIAPDLPLVSASGEHVTQAIVELIRNAVEISRPEDEVIVRAYKHEDKVKVTVTARIAGQEVEKGGLTQAKRSADVSVPFFRIFEPFFPGVNYPGAAETSVPPPHAGNGLGLTRVYIFARSVGARVLFSTQPGKGSSFTIEFPCYEE